MALTVFKEQLQAARDQSPLWQRWRKLPTRDRHALLVLGIFLLAVVFYLGIWQPTQRAQIQAREAYQQQRDLYAHLEQNSETARQLAHRPRSTVAAEQLQGLVTASAQQKGLQVESFANAGESNLTISLPNTPATTLLIWIAELQEQSIQLEQASLQRLDNGLVNASLTLRAGG